jgi:hypothetical protein
MLNACTAVEVLRSLRPHTVVTLRCGSRARVMCQMRELVTVMVGRDVRVVNRWECTEVAS